MTFIIVCTSLLLSQEIHLEATPFPVETSKVQGDTYHKVRLESLDSQFNYWEFRDLKTGRSVTSRVECHKAAK